VCVLPFVDKANVPGLANKVRQSFAGHLSIKHFADAELYEIDSRLETFGAQWQIASTQDLGKALKCNALVYGEVTQASRLYLALYSQLTLEGGILLVDAETGQTLVKDSYATKFRSAGVPLSPLSVLPDVVKNLSNLSDAQMVRAVDDLGRHLAEKVPDLPAMPAPRIVATTFPTETKADPPAAANIPLVSFPAEKKQLPPLRTVAQLDSSASDATSQPMPVAKENPQRAATRRVAVKDEGYRLQVAALRTPADAQRVVLLLRSKGYKPAVTRSVGTTPIWHRVVLGPFPSISSAQKIGAQINKVLNFSPIVMTQPH
jgi:cell division septation protein DedD